MKRFERWLQGRNREREQMRLRNSPSSIVRTVDRLIDALLLLAFMLLWATCLVVACVPQPASAQPALQPIPQSAHQYRATLTRAAHTQWGLSAPIAALAAQVHQESGWKASAISPVGAAGLTQFMPATAKWWCAREQISPAQCQPFNPTWALRSMVGYDKYLYDLTPVRFAPYERLYIALRAYNGGLGHWRAEAAIAARDDHFPGIKKIDAACGAARRAAVHCAENLGYPQRILIGLQPRYAPWGLQWKPAT